MESSIIVAIIGLVGAVVVTLIQQGRKENKTDHNIVANLLKEVHSDVVKVEHKLDGHIKEHKALPLITKKK